jgi:hypothetical protein
VACVRKTVFVDRQVAVAQSFVRSRKAVPRYHLNLRSGGVSVPSNLEGRELSHIDTAFDAALESIHRMASLARLTEQQLNIDAVEISDESGRVLLSVLVSEVLSEAGGLQ